MNKYLLCLISLFVLIISCEEKQDPFEIGQHHIGFLSDSTQVKDLKSSFINDSIVSYVSGDEFINSKNLITIFEKGGKKLLELTPKHSLDSSSVIENVQIIDSRYKTVKNISISSTFKEISNAYTISKINNLINSIIIYVDEINGSFVIDKKELPQNLRYNMNLKIEPFHIPDEAKIKYFFINWD